MITPLEITLFHSDPAIGHTLRLLTIHLRHLIL